MKKVVVAVVAAGCFLQTADAFVSTSAMLGVKPPMLRAASAVRPRSVGLCTVNMGTFSIRRYPRYYGTNTRAHISAPLYSSDKYGMANAFYLFMHECNQAQI